MWGGWVSARHNRLSAAAGIAALAPLTVLKIFSPAATSPAGASANEAMMAGCGYRLCANAEEGLLQPRHRKWRACGETIAPCCRAVCRVNAGNLKLLQLSFGWYG